LNGSKYKRELAGWMDKRKRDNFDLLPENSLFRWFLDYSWKSSKILLTLTKSELKTVNGMLTGH
jgi:hypothetical protein